MDKILVVTGPTATGKTAAAVSLAKKFGGELISADSRQVYRGMDIGTGKDRTSINVPVWMLDIADPREEFSVSHWVSSARSAVEDIHERKKLPVVVGGTGFYISALLYPPETLGIAPNPELRKMLVKKNLSELQTEVRVRLPAVWDKMNYSDRQNTRRLIRKIEVGSIPQNQNFSPYDSFICGLTVPFPELYANIDRRVDERIEAGVLDEIRCLYDSGVRFDMQSMQTLGYREWETWYGNNTEENKADAIRKWKRDEHAYARRQMTYLKKIPGIIWYHPENDSEKLQHDVHRWYTIERV